MRRRALRAVCCTDQCRHLPLPNVPEGSRRAVHGVGQCPDAAFRVDARHARDLPQFLGRGARFLSAMWNSALLCIHQATWIDQRGDRQSGHAGSGDAVPGGRHRGSMEPRCPRAVRVRPVRPRTFRASPTFSIPTTTLRRIGSRCAPSPSRSPASAVPPPAPPAVLQLGREPSGPSPPGSRSLRRPRSVA